MSSSASSCSSTLLLVDNASRQEDPWEDDYDENDEDEDDDGNDDAYMDGFSSDMTKALPTTTTTKSISISHAVRNRMGDMEKLETHKRTNVIDRNDRATSEQVLDPRTRMILFKFLNSGFLESLDGCLSTGKEANVYYGISGGNTQLSDSGSHPKEYAIKIYKTSILVFKDRDRYVSGEHRWRRGYCKSNPRKMVKVWAEKEMRNYKRIYTAGIPCPKPILLKQNVLVMEFLGRNGWPSPRLKDAQLSSSQIREAYVQCLFILRHLFQRCKLVHGDLSEYNLLWHDDRVYVIDVSQSVETDHPAALDFLRHDITNVNEYFAKIGNLDTLTTRQLFLFVVESATNRATHNNDNDDVEEQEHALLDKLLQDTQDRMKVFRQLSEEEQRSYKHTEQVEEAVFLSSFLPRSLNQIAEADAVKIEQGQHVEASYAHAIAALTSTGSNYSRANDNHTTNNEEKSSALGPGLTTTTTATATNIGGQSSDVGANTLSPQTKEKSLTFSEDDDEDNYDHLDEEDDSSDTSPDGFVNGKATPEERQAERDAAKLQRKADKKAVKELQKEKRKTKIKKKDKKRAIKKSKSGNRSHK
jgi:RIO kinase 1